jgi:hypothetical protein
VTFGRCGKGAYVGLELHELSIGTPKLKIIAGGEVTTSRAIVRPWSRKYRFAMQYLKIIII